MRFRATLVAIALLGLPGCRDDTSSRPGKADLSAARSELAARSKSSKSSEKKESKAKKKRTRIAAADAGSPPVEDGFHYDPVGKRDPFRSFEWEQARLDVLGTEGGPLEQFDVNQLSLIGVVWDADNARALLEDPSGTSYIVGKGARVGKNEGRITRIDDNLMVVKETYEDWQGEETTKDVELRIREFEGG